MAQPDPQDLKYLLAVIEDSAFATIELVSVLARAGFAVIPIDHRQPLEAILARVAEIKPDVMLLDNDLGPVGFTGLAVAERLRETQFPGKLAMFSGTVQHIPAGVVDAFISKSGRLRVLTETLQELVAR